MIIKSPVQFKLAISSSADDMQIDFIYYAFYNSFLYYHGKVTAMYI